VRTRCETAPGRNARDSRGSSPASEGLRTADDGVPLPFRRPIDPPTLRAALSSSRLLQIALDTPSLSRAIDLVQPAIEGGAHLIEVGDPLIKNFGMDAIRQIRMRYPAVPLVAEFSSSDWVEDQINNASAGGANIVQVIGLGIESRVARAINAARNVGVGFIVGVSPSPSAVSWAKLAATLGADALAIIRNIDSGTTAQQSLQSARTIKNDCDIPLSVSGGFSPNNIKYAL
jgi:3-hexulose-6-phosphate synthase